MCTNWFAPQSEAAYDQILHFRILDLRAKPAQDARLFEDDSEDNGEGKGEQKR